MPYSKLTDFASKDSLLTGNPAKIVRGTEIDDELNAIETSFSNDVVNQTGSTKSAKLPTGTTAQRDVSPLVGYTRFNTDTLRQEVYDGTQWTSVENDVSNVVTSLTGDGVTTVFTTNGYARGVYISGCMQSPTSYTATATNITFSEAPPLNAPIKIYTNINEQLGGTITASQISGDFPLSQTSGNLAVSQGGTGATATTGTGNNVLSTSPTLVTPVLGTPTSGTLTNCTGLPISTGVSGLGTGVATFLATPSSANLASAVTGETGSGALVFGTAPTLTGDVSLATGNITQGTAAKGFNFTANTPAAGMTSQLLNWYEEGTWTATFKGTTGDPTTPVNATGTYTKIGRIVIVNCELTNFSTVGATGYAYITGLPFAVASGKVAVAAVYLYNFVVYYKYVICVAYNSDVTFEEVRDSSSTSPLSVSPGTGRFLRFTLTYQV